MPKLAFVMAGPQGGQVIEMDDKAFEKAVKDGWVIDFEVANKGGDRDPFRGFNTDSNEHAEAYLSSRGLYADREMRGAKPKSTTGDRADEIEQEARMGDRDQQEEKTSKPAAKPAKK